MAYEQGSLEYNVNNDTKKKKHITKHARNKEALMFFPDHFFLQSLPNIKSSGELYLWQEGHKLKSNITSYLTGEVLLVCNYVATCSRMIFYLS
jgi:hypothetical protein